MTVRGAILVGVASVLLVGADAEGAVPRRGLVYERSGDVILARVDGSHARRIARGVWPKISPDGRWIAFVRPATGLYVVSTSGGRARLFARRVDLAAWSPDSRMLVAEHRTAPLRIVRLSGSVRVLARGPAFGARFSPDSRWVVYSRARQKAAVCGFDADVYRVRVSGGPPQRLTRDHHAGRAIWGPRGIAFTHDVGNCAKRTIWLVRSDGSGAHPIVRRLPSPLGRNGYYGIEPFAWLPNGRLLAEVVAEFRNEAALIDVASGRVRRLGLPLDDVSRDGRWIVGTASGAEYPWSLLIARVGGGRARTIARGRVCCADWNR